MIGHQMVLVYRLDGGSQRLPNFRFDVALNVATHKPDDVGLVLVAVGQERALLHSILHTQQSCLHQSAPDAHHADVDAVLGGHIDDIVHVVPIGIGAG